MSSKLREALSKASIALSWATHHHLTEDDAKECLEVVDAALDEPLRNCDVGTAQEQVKRFRAYCKPFIVSNGMCRNCPLYKGTTNIVECLCKWEQIPYESEEQK